MRWMIELLLAVMLVALAVYALTMMPKSPVSTTMGRQNVETAYNTLLQLSLNPSFLSSLEGSICSQNPQAVKAMLDSAIPQPYIYNFTVYLAGSSPPPCLICATWNSKLLSVARPTGWAGSTATSSATIAAVLPDGTQVKLVLYIGKP
ncbi:hypothetical protein [Thermoproteus tenax]|uniref:Uncharacterized protein n=1 Tax=Thermoproteus tenax (strain ATCC 35583 / DSM 2078 / JCM 9277 / NBRC 100435 / Kra 1) TaxID=768679 RepID=G4RPP7_THETK|nr:hypothetical protein [Thermoproteus tenax]CCC81542.1 hypothetical protein TTX_0888 [Thermoproteus tenax Kra 1]